MCKCYFAESKASLFGLECGWVCGSVWISWQLKWKHGKSAGAELCVRERTLTFFFFCDTAPIYLVLLLNILSPWVSVETEFWQVLLRKLLHILFQFPLASFFLSLSLSLTLFFTFSSFKVNMSHIKSKLIWNFWRGKFQTKIHQDIKQAIC